MTYRFGPFALDTDARQLTRDGEEIHLSPKAFDLLTLLVANRARVLSKTELQARLWPSTFVEETNLATLVAEIRRALRDSPRHARFVRTVHRVGYRFIADTSEPMGPAPSGTVFRRFLLLAAGRQFALREGRNVIGRGGDAAVRLDAAGVSRHHAAIVVSGDEAWLEDLGSKNGTLVCGQPATQPRRLADGDDIMLGGVVLTFQATPATAPTATLTTA